MIYHCRLGGSSVAARLRHARDKLRLLVSADWAGRLVQIALAIYLLPALLVVLVVGGLGMLVIAVVSLFNPRGAKVGRLSDENLGSKLSREINDSVSVHAARAPETSGDDRAHESARLSRGDGSN